MTIKLPEGFPERIQQQLGSEFEEFLKSYDVSPSRGIRVNTLKTDSEFIAGRAPFNMEPVWWVQNGFFISKDDDPAGHLFYRAGLYYIQEPSAMTPADRLPVEPGDKVLDLCAAPGGKATALAAKLAGKGLLVANDASASRCRALMHNLELSGAGNIIVTNELPQSLENKFPGFFDKIMVDAPCSGEGMFRKEPEVIETWSPERVEYFAAQQRSILKSAVSMLKDGGYLMYSTCTFSPQEDEGSVSYVLENFPEMEPVEIDGYEGFSSGVPEFGNGDERLRKTVRIWPHKMRGEGHFLALFRKNASLEENSELSEGNKEGAVSGSAQDGIYSEYKGKTSDFDKNTGRRRKNKTAGRDKREKKGGYNSTFNAEDRRVMDGFLLELNIDIEKEKLENRKGKVYLMPLPSGELPRLKFLRVGMYMGELKKNRFEPSQSFALYLPGDGYKNRISLTSDDPRLKQYFAGESISLTPGEENLPNGFVLVEAQGYPVGFGKKSGSMIKSRYIRLK